MRLCNCSCTPFEDTFENSLRRKITQMQPMQLCNCLCKQFEETFENPLWRKGIQVQPVRLFISSGRQFEDTFENSLGRKTTQMQPMWLCSCSESQFEETFENSFWGKPLRSLRRDIETGTQKNGWHVQPTYFHVYHHWHQLQLSLNLDHHKEKMLCPAQRFINFNNIFATIWYDSPMFRWWA